MDKQCYYRVGIKGIVIDEQNRILLTKEDNGKWEMLGGGLEHGEDPIDCLRREIKEEAGLEVTYISPSPKYFLTAARIGTTPGYVANIIYEIRLKDLDFIPSDECLELKFFTLEDMEKVDLFPNVQKLLTILKERHPQAASL